jgi:phosphoglycerate dehydrogenase-like enzyme
VCVPQEIDRAELEVAPGVEVLVWSGQGLAPEGIERTEFLLAPYMGTLFEPSALDRLPELKVIQLLSAGVEPWLSRVPTGVQLCNGRGVHGGSTAELAVAGLLALLRGLPRYLRQQGEGEWAEHTTGDLDGARVLLLGAGDINGRVAGALQALGAECVFVARTARDGVAGIEELASLLPGARAVVVALPHTVETHHLVNAAFLAALPDGAVVVNVARGTVADTDALVAELSTGRISAFLDVSDPEPLPSDHPLWRMQNVMITPHVGGGTSGWRRRAMALAGTQVARFVAGEELLNQITGNY